MKSRAAKRRHARKRKSPAIYLKMSKTQEIEGKDNGNMEISENLLTTPINEKNKSTKTMENLRVEKLQNTRFKGTDNNCYLNRNPSRKLALYHLLSYLKSTLVINLLTWTC